jgi:hypothetical protein
LSVTPERWETIREGDRIEVVYVPGDPWPYLRDDVFVSGGNFVFDFVLLGVELGVAGVMAWQLWRLRGRARAAARPGPGAGPQGGVG